MSIITVNRPKLSNINKKRKLVEKLTGPLVEAYGLSKEEVIVVIQETEPENVGVGGMLVLDMQAGE